MRRHSGSSPILVPNDHDPTTSTTASDSSFIPSSSTTLAADNQTQSSSIGIGADGLLSATRRRLTKGRMFSPRSSNYERLEGGMGPSRNSLGRRFAWKKVAIGAVVLVGLLFLLGPRKEDLDEYMPTIVKPGSSKDGIAIPAAGPEPTKTTTQLPVRPPHEDDEITAGGPPRPTDPASDGDLTKTHYCTKPYKDTLPLVQYALMVDAGSTGSRIHIYKFNNCGPTPAYEYEVFKMLQPGLSDYEGDPRGAAASLDALFDEAMHIVPAGLRACTPVAVKATAGLRRLGTQQAADILAAVRARLQERYPFSLHGTDPVTIMEGRDEGVYAWLTANYLLKTLSPRDQPMEPLMEPYAVLDLGGASTQIVFEPTFEMDKPDATLEDGEHKYELKYDGVSHVLYQHSYLGYGLMTARQSVHRLVEFMASIRGSDHGKDARIVNPCVAKTTEKIVEIEDERLGGKWNLTMVGEDVGSYESCKRVVELVMGKDAICEVKPCSFNGVYQPSLLETFPHGKILLLSYFYDRLDPFIAATVNPLQKPIRVSMFEDVAKTVCEGPELWRQRWGGDEYLMGELEGRPEWCLDLTFMHALLRLGYEFSGEREIELGKRIEGTELGWCLGATISMITGAELKCRV